MDWSWVLEKTPAAIGAARDLIVAGAAISTARVGWLALGKWRDETVGKRHLELAEDVLAAFYQVQEIIHDARARYVDARERAPEEGVPEEITSDPAYAPRRRLREASDKIGDLRVKRHRFAAMFGQQSTAPWDAIEAVLHDIDYACGALLELRGERVLSSDPNAGFYIQERRIAFRSKEDDPIASRVTEAVGAIEATCRPIIQASVRGRRTAERSARTSYSRSGERQPPTAS